MADKTRIWNSFLLFLFLACSCEGRIFSRKYKHKETIKGENDIHLNHQCNRQCVCQNMKAFCDGKLIKSVPRRLPVNVEYLNLKDNQLRKIRARHLKDLPRLKHLLLKGNSIYHIDSDAFRDLGSLMSLSLTENMIRRLAPDTFKGLYRLQYLSVRTNKLKNIDGLFDPLKSMTLLNLGENRLEKITDDTFRRTSHLRVLDLHNNSISFIARNAFRYLPYLKYLVLRDNPLRELNLDFKVSFHLELLDLTNCSLTEVPEGLPYSINDLRLSENRIRVLKSHDFKSARKIRLLVLNKNEIEIVPPDAFSRLWQLHDLYLGANKMKKLPQKLPSSIHGFYANHNNISEIPAGVFGSRDSQLEFLYLKNNSIENISREAFRVLKKVKSIDLSWNRIRNIEAFTFSDTRDLEVLDLSKNPLRNLGHDSFYGLTNLHILQMASIITDANASLHPSVFKNTENIMFLDLSNSSSLVRHLAENPYVLDLLSSLEDLNLMYDNLYSLPETFPQHLPKLKAIKLIGNPWHCDTTIYWLTEWMRAAQVEFFAKDDMVCASPPELRGRRISELHLSMLPKVNKPVKVEPWIEPIDLPIHHGDVNFSFILNYTTDAEDTSEDSDHLVNVSLSARAPIYVDVATTTTAAKSYEKDSKPDLNNRIFKSRDGDKLKKRRHKNGYFNDQHKKRQKPVNLKHSVDPYDSKTRSKGRHRIVETEGSDPLKKDSKTRLFAHLLSQDNGDIISSTDGSGSADPVQKSGGTGQEEGRKDIHTQARPGLFYEAYVRTGRIDNQNSGEDGV